MMFDFTHPKYLLLLFVVPLVILIHFYSLRSRKSFALTFANFGAISRIKGVDLYSKNIVIAVLALVISVLVVLSLSGMRMHTEVETSDFSFIIAIDSSRSMEAVDVEPSRIAAAKQRAVDFVREAALGTRIGVITFSGNAFIESPLTDDHSVAITALQNIGLSDVGGTDAAEAIITGTNMLEGEARKAIIILSDGQVNVEGIDDALDYANRHDVIVHTIALGTKEGGATSYGISKLDEDSLKALSYNTKGVFFEAASSDALSQSFSQILTLKTGRVAINLAPYLLMAAVLLILVQFFLVSTHYRTLP